MKHRGLVAWVIFGGGACLQVNRNGSGRIIQGGSNMTGTVTGLFTHKQSRSYLNHLVLFNPYPTSFPYGNGMVLHFYQQQESTTTKTVHKVINKGLKTYE